MSSKHLVLAVPLLMAALVESGQAQEKEGSKKLERGDAIRVTDSSGDVIQGILEEVSPDGRALKLRKAERFSIEARLRRTPLDSQLTVTLIGGERVRGTFADVSGTGFALRVDPDQDAETRGLPGRIRKTIPFEDVYAVFHTGELDRKGGAAMDVYVASLPENRQFEVQHRDPNWNGTLYGALVGLGIAALSVQGCCDNPDYAPSTAFVFAGPLLGGLGAGIGYYVDKGHGNEFSRYQPTPSPGSTWSLRVQPSFTREGAGIRFSLRY